MNRNVKEIKIVIVEALIKEEGEVTAERMLYAYHRIRERFRNVEELLELLGRISQVR